MHKMRDEKNPYYFVVHRFGGRKSFAVFKSLLKTFLVCLKLEHWPWAVP